MTASSEQAAVRRVQDSLNQYHVFDSRAILQQLPSRPFVDVTVTSPPYWNLKDYGSSKQIGFGQKYDECLADLTTVFGGVHELTKASGSLWIVADTIKSEGELRLFPFDLATRLKSVGWILQDIIVWHKDKTLPWSHRGKLRNIFEYILFFTKTNSFKYDLTQVREIDDLKEWWVKYPERYSPLGKAPARTWSIPIPRQGSWGENWVRHFCPLPPDLVRRIVLLTTKSSDVVLDPFAGSGVVLAQAAALGRSFVGVDLRENYKKMFKSTVLPSIRALEKSRSTSVAFGERARKEFESTIWKLRKLKLPKELQRLYVKKHGKPPLSMALVLPRESTDIKVYLVGPEKLDLEKWAKLLEKPPLSKYGIAVRLKAVTVDELENGFRHTLGLSGQKKLYVYEKGNTSYYSKRVELANVADILSCSNRTTRFAPIISPIGCQLRKPADLTSKWEKAKT